MAKKSRLKIIQDTIIAFFDSLPQKAFGYNDIAEILSAQRDEWGISSHTYNARFIDFLTETGLLKEITLTSRSYSPLSRYIWRNPSVYSIALSIKKKGYLSHGSAVFIHGLTDLIPKTVYINHEQSPKTQKGVLIQGNIHRAFAGKQRQSKLIYEYDEYKITLINGKFTDRLGVISLTGGNSEILETTNLERTLIDIAVRPSYAGGVFEVLEIYKKAKDLVSASKLISTLKRLDYVYPYHQVIGFYMERSNYPTVQWKKLLNIGLDFDFYLTYNLPPDKKHDSKWRLFYPNGL